jgi:hypothetical protein
MKKSTQHKSKGKSKQVTIKNAGHEIKEGAQETDEGVFGGIPNRDFKKNLGCG